MGGFLWRTFTGSEPSFLPTQKLLSAAGCAKQVFQSRGNWISRSYKKFDDFEELQQLFSKTEDITAEDITDLYLPDKEWETTWEDIKCGGRKETLLQSMGKVLQKMGRRKPFAEWRADIIKDLKKASIILEMNNEEAENELRKKKKTGADLRQ